jgi:DNA invertase Pin-like site-specific DNA recombinase
MKKMVFYLRVLNLKQVSDGNVIQHQMTFLNRYAEANGGEIVGQFIEVESGGKTIRKGLNWLQLLKSVRKKMHFWFAANFSD